MTDADVPYVPSTCDVCGKSLSRDYSVRRHHIDNPVTEGRWNPLTPDTWISVAFGDDSYIERTRTCDDCEPPESPPKPSRRRHIAHAVVHTVASILIASSLPSVAAQGGSVALASTVAILAAVGAVGELVQIWMISSDGRVDDEDADPAAEARKAYLAGEITEAELEERLDEELSEEERDRETRVIER